MKKVLILEDDIEVLCALNLFIEGGEYVTTPISSYAKAIKHINIQYDILIVDIVLDNEKNTGIDFAIRYKNNWPNTRIIAVTGYKEKIPDASLHADLVFPKPINFKELANILQDIPNKTTKNLFERILKVEKAQVAFDKKLSDQSSLNAEQKALNAEIKDFIAKNANSADTIRKEFKQLILSLVGFFLVIIGIQTGMQMNQIDNNRENMIKLLEYKINIIETNELKGVSPWKRNAPSMATTVDSTKTEEKRKRK